MKGYKIFQVCYTLNFLICITSLSASVYKLITNWSMYSSYISLYIILFLLTFVFIIFDWLCYRFLHSVKTGALLPDKLRIAADGFNKVCLLVSTIAGIVIADRLVDKAYSVHQEFYSIGSSFLQYSLLCIIATSIYLCVTYWFIRNHANLEIEGMNENFGTE